MSSTPADTAGVRARVLGAAKRAADAALDRSGGADHLLRPFVARADAAGVPSSLIDHARSMADRRGRQRQAVACLRLATRVADGDRSAMTPLLHKLGDPPDDELMWDALRLAGLDVDGLSLDSEPDEILAAVAPEAERSFATAGYSTVIEWLATRDRLPESAEALTPLIRVLIERSIESRDRSLRADPGRTEAGLRAVVAAVASLAGDVDRPDLALWGPSVLTATEPESSPYFPGPFEIAVFLDRGDALTAVRSLGEAVEIVDVSPTSIVADVVGHRVEFVCVERDAGELIARAHGHVRRHHDTGFAPLDVGRVGVPAPADVGLHLDERFGDRSRHPLFVDPWFDSPNTEVDDSLDGLFVTEHRVHEHIRRGDRLVADVWTARLRDAFGADYTRFVPTPIDRRVLATPVTSHEIAGRPLVAVIAPFEALDLPTLRRLDDLRSTHDDAFVVAAVVGDRSSEATDRLRTVASCALVDATLLIPTPDALPDGLDGAAWHRVISLDESHAEAAP